MLSLIQRVTHAEVKVDNVSIAAIETGILALIGMEKMDTEKEVERLFEKIINYRIFPDTNGKTNLSLKDSKGGLLLVPQFTLVSETKKGMRPGFSRGMSPEEGKKLFGYFVDYAKKHYAPIASGCFGAYMQVTLCNDGPMTFILQS